jgi:hypothetical protein
MSLKINFDNVDLFVLSGMESIMTSKHTKPDLKI